MDEMTKQKILDAKKRFDEQTARINEARKIYDTPKIARKDLIHGAYYKGHCRNAEEARWNERNGCFVHWRTKFGQTFLEEIKHPEDEQYYDVFVVEEILEKPTKEIPL